MKKVFALFLLLASSLVFAAPASIFKAEVKAPMQITYKLLYEALEKERLWVVFEADIGQNLSAMADRLGEDYNRNKLESLRTMVVCNAFLANRVSNLDPDMLALCPLRVAVTHKAGTTQVLFAKPTIHAQGSAALPVVLEIENSVIDAIKTAMGQAAVQEI